MWSLEMMSITLPFMIEPPILYLRKKRSLKGEKNKNHVLLNPKLQLFPIHATIRIIIFVRRKG